jgi:chromosome segregation ATPase
MSDDVTHNVPNDLLQQILDRLGGIESRLDGMDSRLGALEAKSHDTRPIWERALSELGEVKQGLAEVKQELVEVNRRLDSMDRRLSVLNDDVLHMRAEHRKLEDRVERLESPRS